ncbi:lysine exporter LysO family protein [Vibrio sp.]|nr:lysine exporter LysO family protein [Vibrio sp.]
MYFDLLAIFLPLLLGYFFKFKNNSPKLNTINNMTARIIFIILAIMGLSLAQISGLEDHLSSMLGLISTFYLALLIFNVLGLLLIERLFPLSAHRTQATPNLLLLAKESINLIGVVIVGFLIGKVIAFEKEVVDVASEWTLYLLLFFIGIQLRNSGLTLKQILVNKQGMVIALVVIFTSFIAGGIVSIILDINLYHALAISSGFGWYSLSGILISESLGPLLGGASFIIELLRELTALFLIPLFIQRIPSTSIGYAGATAMDFTLPIIQSQGGVKCIPVAIVSGFILSLLVPVFMLFFLSIAP